MKKVFNVLKSLYIKLFDYEYVPVGWYLRFAYFKKILNGFRHENFKKILDAGCWTGKYSIYLSTAFPDSIVDAIDVCELTEIKNSINYLHITNINAFQKNLFDLEAAEEYDFICCVDVLEHIKNNEIIIGKFYSALRSSGILYLHMPQKDFSEINFINKKYFKYWREHVEKDHIGEHYTLDEMVSVLQKIGFKVMLKRKTFGFFGEIAWELDQFVIYSHHFAQKLIRPFLKSLALCDIFARNKRGGGILVIARKQVGGLKT